MKQAIVCKKKQDDVDMSGVVFKSGRATKRSEEGGKTTTSSPHDSSITEEEKTGQGE